MICHPEEVTWLEVLMDKIIAFYRLWTAKEALLKANGSGLINDLKALNCVDCLRVNRCLITWQSEQYWIHLVLLEMGGVQRCLVRFYTFKFIFFCR
jgi:phosphopantetheinyl transferase